MIFDTHAHYDDEAFDGDRELLLASLPEKGIGRVTEVSSDLASIQKVKDLAERFAHVYAAYGIHPTECAPMNEEHLAKIRELLLTDPKAVAVGEIGLDYYWDEPERELQKHWFREQLLLAQEVDRPVIIHSREAAADTYDIMKEMHAEKTGGVVHCFSYSREMAEAFIRMGFYIGIGGVLTYKNARKLVEVAEAVPMDRIVLETDCPYLSPVPHRGKRNSSLNLPLVVQKLADIRGITADEVIRITEENALRLYRLA